MGPIFKEFMQYSMSFPFSRTYLDKEGNLHGLSEYLSIDIYSDPFVNGEAIENHIKKKMKESWKTLWISPEFSFDIEDPLVKLKGNGFYMEVPLANIHIDDHPEEMIEMDLAEEGLDCEVEILPLDPNEKSLLGIDFICPTLLGGGGCLLVEAPIPLPKNFLDTLQNLRGRWLLHEGLVVDKGDQWLLQEKKTLLLVDKKKTLIAPTPLQGLAREILKATDLESVKFKFLEGTRLAFSSDSI